jgi:thymidylate synthase ThyX
VESDAERALRYRNLAHEFRARAKTATNDETREIFLALSRDYHKLAQFIEEADKNRFS